MDIITSSLDHGLPVDVIYCSYVDLQNTFDSVPHSRLLLHCMRAESYGGYFWEILGWIRGFLSDRE